MLDWLNNFKNNFETFSTTHAALAAASITGTVTFVAGMLSQVLSHQFTKKRDKKKSREEAFSKLFSPLSIEVYKYLTVYSQKPEAMITGNGEFKKFEERLNELWGNIAKLIADNKQATTLELSHNFTQINRDIGDGLDFAENFFKEYKKMAKKVRFNEKIHGNTPKDILNFIKLYDITYSRYGPFVAPYIFRTMNSANSIKLRKTLRKLKLPKEKISRREYKRIPFDDTFETLVINNIKPSHRIKINQLIDYELNRRQQLEPKPKEFF